MTQESKLPSITEAHNLPLEGVIFSKHPQDSGIIAAMFEYDAMQGKCLAGGMDSEAVESVFNAAGIPYSKKHISGGGTVTAVDTSGRGRHRVEIEYNILLEIEGAENIAKYKEKGGVLVARAALSGYRFKRNGNNFTYTGDEPAPLKVILEDLGIRYTQQDDKTIGISGASGKRAIAYSGGQIEALTEARSR